MSNLNKIKSSLFFRCQYLKGLYKNNFVNQDQDLIDDFIVSFGDLCLPEKKYFGEVKGSLENLNQAIYNCALSNIRSLVLLNRVGEDVSRQSYFVFPCYIIDKLSIKNDKESKDGFEADFERYTEILTFLFLNKNEKDMSKEQLDVLKKEGIIDV